MCLRTPGPARHLLVVNRELLDVLLSAGFRLGPPDIHVLENRSVLDIRRERTPAC